MAGPADYISQLPQSRFTAEELLRKVAAIAVKIATVEELNQDFVDEIFDVRPEEYEAEHADYAARLTPEWNVSIEFSTAEPPGPMLELAFFDSSEGVNAPMAEISGVDAAAFETALSDAGFKHTTIHGVHGGILGDDFVRGSIRVMMSTRGETAEPPERTARRCITSVRIQRRE